MSTRILSGIYVVRNSVNGRVYVGSAVNLAKRWGAHRQRLNQGTHQSPRLQSAWNKYGEDAFSFEIIEIIERKEDLVAREQVHLDDAFASGLCYNLARIAGNTLGVKHTDAAVAKMVLAWQTRPAASAETRARMSLSQKGRPGRTPSAETVTKISLANTGKKHSAKTRAVMSLAHKGRPALNKGTKHSAQTIAKMVLAHTGQRRSAETRDKISLALTGKTHSAIHRENNSLAHKGKRNSAEARAKMSLAKAGKLLSEWHRERISLALKGRRFSSEHLAKMSLANKGKKLSAETRAKVSLANIGRVHSAESRAKMSAARTEFWRRRKTALAP